MRQHLIIATVEDAKHRGVALTVAFQVFRGAVADET
jgi:hypothetical protein